MFPTLLQYSPLHSQQKRQALGLVNHKISELRNARKKLNQTEYITSFTENISYLLIPLPPGDEIPSLCQRFIQVLLQGNESDGSEVY